MPLAGAQVAQALTGFVDTLMMGRLGAATLAAGGLATITFMTLIGVVGAVATAVTPLIAEANATDRKQVATIASQGVYLVLFATVPLTITVAKIDRLFLALGQEPTVVTLADTYLDLMVWSCFPATGSILLRGIVSGLACARPIASIAIWGTLFNIGGNYVLAFGKLGFPPLGISGLAIASVVTHWGMFLSLALYIARHPQLKTYSLVNPSRRFQLDVFSKLLRLGIPIGLFIALESGLFAVVSYLMGMVNTETLAAHQIVLQTIVIIFMVPLGISHAATIRVGHSYGRQHILGIQRAAYLSIALGLLFNLLMAIAVCLFPQVVIGLYLDPTDPSNLPIIKIAVPMLIVGVVALILDGMQKIVYGVLQGLQDTQFPVILSIMAFWGVGLTTGYILGFNYSLGGIGLWLGQSLGLAIAAVLFCGRTMSLIDRLKCQSLPK